MRCCTTACRAGRGGLGALHLRAAGHDRLGGEQPGGRAGAAGAHPLRALPLHLPRQHPPLAPDYGGVGGVTAIVVVAVLLFALV